jgi:Ser/Thr protein kinase RdoA (MazF antagonist)
MPGRWLLTARLRHAGPMEEPAANRTRLLSFSPIFGVRDLARALAHYQSLGFDVEPSTGGDGYGFADRDGLSLHLALEQEHGHEHAHHEHAHHEDAHHEHAHHEQAGTAYLEVEDADALYDEWARPGIGGLTRPVGNTAYKLREGSHIDPDGNVIRFGSPMPGKPAERLRAHLQARYGIDVTAMTDLDLGVWRVGRADGPDWVARWFPARRPAEAVAGDAEILRYAAAHDFPAERCAADEPVSALDGRGVLVTEWADPVPRERRREAIRAVGGLGRLGALVGRLTTLPAADGACSRPGGAWHHLADGLPAAEVAAAARMLTDHAHLIPDAERAAYEALLAEVNALDTADGLPEALIHPDFVLANVVATSDAMVVVDWAGAGRGPRVWSLAFLLYAEGAKDLRRVDVVLAGYRRHVTLTGEELDRLASIARARPLVLSVWSVCTGRTTPTVALAHAAEVKTLTEAVAARARAALARAPRA